MVTWLIGSLTGPLWDGVCGAIGGGVIGALLTIRAERRRSQMEIALTFMEQFMAQYDELAHVKGLLENVAHLQQPTDINRVRKFGDWCEIVSATVLSDAADRRLLKNVGIPDEMKIFYDGAVKASKQVPGLQSALPGWTNLAKYVRQG